MRPRPNILIILADDLGYEALGCYGGLSYGTPELDLMAAEGLRLSRAYTSPVCTPTRVSLHTSLYSCDHGYTEVLPVHLGTSDYVDFTAMPTFAQLFQQAGYQTSTTGKWQLATLTKYPDHIASAGFDSWCVWQIWNGSAKTGRYWNPYLNRDGSVLTGIENEFGPDVLCEYVKERMATAVAAGEPFMIVHNEMLPHIPIVKTPANGTASLANMINYMDYLVGELLDEVEALGIRDNTYVFFIGDNGTETDATRHTADGDVTGGKRDLQDIGTHIPFIVWGPSVVRVGVEDDLIDITDIFPTVCSLAGIKIPDTIEYRGRSFAPLLEGREGLPRQWVHQGINGEQSIFDGQWRLQKNGALYDSRNLPTETEVTTPTTESDAAKEKLEHIYEYLDGTLHSNNRGGYIIDNGDDSAVTIVGEWKKNSVTSGFYGSDYLHDLNTGQGTKSVSFHYAADSTGNFEIGLRWTENNNRASNAAVEVTTPGGTQSFTINQRKNGGEWNTLTTVYLDAGDKLEVMIHNTDADGYVIADAIRIQAEGLASFSEWTSLNFDAGTLADSELIDTVWGELADPDHDGLVNLMEFALGEDPRVSRQAPLLFSLVGDTLSFRVILRKSENGFSVYPEYSYSLGGGWTAMESPLFEVVASAPIDHMHDEKTYAYAGPTPLPGALFIRVNAN